MHVNYLPVNSESLYNMRIKLQIDNLIWLIGDFQIRRISTIIVLILIFTICYINSTLGQTYYAFGDVQYFEVELDGSFCSCSSESQGFVVDYGGGATYSPEGNFYIMGGPALFAFDLTTGDAVQVATWPLDPNPNMEGIVSTSDSTFYIFQALTGRLFSWNINSGVVNDLGSTGFVPIEGLALFDGELFGASFEGIWRIDVAEPSNSYLVFPDNSATYHFSSPTASSHCNLIIANKTDNDPNSSDTLVSINLVDGAVTAFCQIGFNNTQIATFLEHVPPAYCDNALDLDCNDSSGATDADFNSTEVSCTMRQAAVADEDVRLFYDAVISEMTISVTGFMPDGINEIIDITGSVPGINASGQGTNVLTLSNAGGAKSTDFIDALHLVQYMNTALNPTAGLRTIEVQFTTESGSQSNVATAFIQLNELPPLVVDIGPDQTICAGTEATFDAGSFPGGMYQWSNGPTTQSITTTIDGQYIVTVSDDSHCPGTDTAMLMTIPVITVALMGDTEICDNQSATLTINTNAPFPITVEIQADPGSPFVFDDVMGNYSFTDLPQDNTTYTIISVTPSSEACIEITDAEQVIDVYPAYEQMVDVSICDGDSVWLGVFWETEAGVYENVLTTINGCDSLVTTTISILPAVMIQIQEDTCDASAVGVFVTTIDNPNGCDTVVTTTVTLLSADTTYVYDSSCRIADVGVMNHALTGSDGCDSLIVTTTDYVAPGDTTFLFSTTCDSAQLGVMNNTLTGADGCDSLIVTTMLFAELDTTYLFATTCDSMQIGIVQDTAVGIHGCDSIIITTTTFAMADTTYLFATSCDPSDVGVTSSTITGVDGCDSTLITTITFSEQDSVFISSTTCDPADEGVFVAQYVNQFGCDSIVTTTISLLPSDTLYLMSASCLPADTGVMTTHFLNQFGCDSMVITTVSLLPSEQTFLNETTCQASQAGMFITTHFNQFGCDSIVTLTVSLVAADTIELFFKTCDPSQVGVINHTTTGSDGCDSVIVEITELYPLPILDVQSAIDYNGFDISCIGEPDGSAIAIIAGVGPYAYLWSTADTDQQITGLYAGDYAVTITDGNGCTSDAAITLVQPEELMMGFEVSEPGCFDQALGVISVNALGGVPPYSYAIDGGLFQDSPVFNALGDGIYQLTVMDANGCTAADIISIDVPLMIHVDLGADQTINVGDTTILQAIVNLPFDSISTIHWNGLDTSACANCLTQIVAPVITTAYAVSVTSVDGCSDADTMNLSVITKQHLYIPNIFSPNGDGVNDVLQIGADDGVREISAMEIFDRWGNLVFGFEHKAPDDPEAHWDGLFKGQVLNPGVFTYKAVILYASGETKLRYGDVTLMR